MTSMRYNRNLADIFWNCLRIFSTRYNWNLAKTRFETVLEYLRWLQKKRINGKVRREEKLEFKGKRVLPRVIKQMSGSEQLKFVAECWVFIPRLVTWPGHVVEHVGHAANRKIPIIANRSGQIRTFISLKLNLEIVQFQLYNSSCRSI